MRPGLADLDRALPGMRRVELAGRGAAELRLAEAKPRLRRGAEAAPSPRRRGPGRGAACDRDRRARPCPRRRFGPRLPRPSWRIAVDRQELADRDGPRQPAWLQT